MRLIGNPREKIEDLARSGIEALRRISPTATQIVAETLGGARVLVETALTLQRIRAASLDEETASNPLLAKIYAPVSEREEGDKQRYDSFIDGSGLDFIDRGKLKELMSIENYRKAVLAAQALDPNCEIPSYEQISSQLQQCPPATLRNICEMMESPTLLIVSANSFDEKIDAMDKNKHAKDSKGRKQEDAYVYRTNYRGANSPYHEVGNAPKVRVSITNGIPQPSLVNMPKEKPSERREDLTHSFSEKGMHHIDCHQMATLLQQTLITAEMRKDTASIANNSLRGNTATVLDKAYLTETPLVAFAKFHRNQVYFSCTDPNCIETLIVGRATFELP